MLRPVLSVACLAFALTLQACSTAPAAPRYRTVEIAEPSEAAPKPLPPAVTKAPAVRAPAKNPRTSDATPSAPATLISDCQANFEEKIAAAMKAIEDRKARI